MPMTTKPVDFTTVRLKLWSFLSPDVARDVGMSFEQLRLIVSGRYRPDDATLTRLARRMGMIR